MYTHTKEKYNTLWISQAICEHIWLQPKATCLVCLHNLVWERRRFTRRRLSRGRLHFFHRALPKVETGVRNQNTNVAVQQYVPMLFFQERVYLSASDHRGTKAVLSFGRLTKTHICCRGCANNETHICPSRPWTQHLWLLVRGTLSRLCDCMKVTQKQEEKQFRSHPVCEQWFTAKRGGYKISRAVRTRERESVERDSERTDSAPPLPPST